MPKISGRVLLSVSWASSKRLPAGMLYVVPTPGGPNGTVIGMIRRIFPLRSFVLPDVRWASQYSRPARSSIGSKPLESYGFVLSPVEM
jgi:hypothetical protein